MKMEVLLTGMQKTMKSMKFCLLLGKSELVTSVRLSETSNKCDQLLLQVLLRAILSIFELKKIPYCLIINK